MGFSISKLSENRKKQYALYITYINRETKKQKRKFIKSFVTKEEAKIYKIAYLSGRIDMLKNNNNIKGLTFEEVYHLWLQQKEVELKETSLKNIKTYFKRSHKLHKIEMKNIKGALLNDIFNQFNLTSGSLRNIKSFWKEIWDYAILNDYAEKNYPTYLKIPKIEKGKKTSNRNRVLSENELNILWDNLYKDKRNIIDMVLILTYTGLRIGELLNLRIVDVNLIENYINVKSAKTKSGIRKVPIAKKIKPLLEKRKNDRLTNKDKVFNLNDYLFTAIDGRAYKYDSFDNHFRILFKTLALSYHTIHDTRHTFTTMISNTEANKDLIIKLVGHKNYKTTSEVYIHKNIEQMQQVVNLI